MRSLCEINRVRVFALAAAFLQFVLTSLSPHAAIIYLDEDFEAEQIFNDLLVVS